MEYFDRLTGRTMHSETDADGTVRTWAVPNDESKPQKSESQDSKPIRLGKDLWLGRNQIARIDIDIRNKEAMVFGIGKDKYTYDIPTLEDAVGFMKHMAKDFDQ